MNRLITTIIALLLYTLNGIAQDSTFRATLAAEILTSQGIYSFSYFTTADLDWDGKQELIFSACVAPSEDYPRGAHTIGIIQDGEIVSLSEFRHHWVRTPLLMVADINGDGRREIVYEHFRFRTLEIYSIPDLELIFTREYSFDGRGGVYNGDVWKNENDDDELVFAHHYTTNASGGNWSRSYHQCRIVTGSPMEGYPEHIAWISNPLSFVLKERSYGSGTDYFIAGRTNCHYRVDNEFEEMEFRLLNTSYKRELNEPDSLLIYSWDEMNIAAEDSGYGCILSKHAVVEDLNNDGDLKWVVPWCNLFSFDTSLTHIQIYNPEDLELLDELIIGTEGLDIRHYIPALCKGVKLIDIDDDEDWELLVYLANEPLMIVDPEEMRVIMTSEEVMPNYLRNLTFELGHFVGDGDNLQVVVQSHLDRILIYNLPDDWTNYYTVKKQSAESVRDFRLFTACPNPFNAVTRIAYAVPTPSHVKLAVYDLSGRMVGLLADGEVSTGRHVCEFDGGELAAGLYFVRLEVGSDILIRKVVMVK